MSCLKQTLEYKRGPKFILTSPNSTCSSETDLGLSEGDIALTASGSRRRLRPNNKVDHDLSFTALAAWGKASFKISHKGCLPRHTITDAISSGL